MEKKTIYIGTEMKCTGCGKTIVTKKTVEADGFGLGSPYLNCCRRGKLRPV